MANDFIRILNQYIGESVLVGQGITIRTGRFPVQIPLDDRPSFGIQPW